MSGVALPRLIARPVPLPLALGLLALGMLLAPSAMAADNAITGTLKTPDGKPVVGVAITVTADGFTQSASTGADGTFTVIIPKGGTYTVALDEKTLPAGVSLANPGEASRQINVLSGTKRILFDLGAGGQTDSGSTSGSTVGLG